MSALDETPGANRAHIVFFGLRNAGKSTLVNEFCNQPLAIVSEVPGTTTDPVSKAMEIAPLGPCLITDTAGLDDVGTLGEMRVKKSLEALEKADVAVWVTDGVTDDSAYRARIEECCRRRHIAFFVYRRGDDVDALRERVAKVELSEAAPPLLAGLVKSGDLVICVTPIDGSAPKGRLILPQVQVLRECLDLHAFAIVCQVEELPAALAAAKMPVALVVTDSQVFAKVRSVLAEVVSEKRPPLTSFSILLARQKGDLAEFRAGLKAVRALKDGDMVIISEACTHRRNCEDIGEKKIPAAVMKLSGAKHLNFVFSSGPTFNADTMRSLSTHAGLIVHCGGCMLTRRALLSRIAQAQAAKVPIVNYGMLLAAASGMTEVSADGLVDG